MTHTRRVRELHELIAALDRRVPRADRVAEASIATDAAALKLRALKQIAELQDDTNAVLQCSALERQTATAG